jgi:hypothetical protein
MAVVVETAPESNHELSKPITGKTETEGRAKVSEINSTRRTKSNLN